MTLRTLMQTGPAKANELFAKLSDTSDGAVKTREKLFAELKAELELHIGLEEQHLFPILRRQAETKQIVAEAIKDNKALRAKLDELEALPKNDEAFPQGLKELQKTFRQHARDDKRELLPAVQRALSDDQVQSVAEKMEVGLAEAEQARHDEVEARRAKVRQERERAEQQADRQAEAERTEKTAVDQALREATEQKRATARHERAEAERYAEQEAAAQQAQDEAERGAHDAAEAIARTATAAQANVLHFANSAASNAQRMGREMQSGASTYIDMAETLVPDIRIVAELPRAVMGAMTEFRSAWIEWMGQTTRAGAQISQEVLHEAAERQRQFAAAAMQGWMAHSARMMQITMRVAQEGLHPFANRSAGSDER